MRLHKPVHPSQQPHLQSFFQGGIPADGRFAPNAAANAGAFDGGGSVGDLPPVSQASDLLSVTPSKPNQWSDEDEARRIATDNTLVDTINSRGLNMSVPKMNRGIAGAIKNFISPAQAATDDGGSGGAYDDGGLVDPKAYLRWPDKPPIPQGKFASGGPVPVNSMLGPIPKANAAQLAAAEQRVYNAQRAASRGLGMAYGQSGLGGGAPGFGNFPSQGPGGVYGPIQSYAGGGDVSGGDDSSGEVNPTYLVDPSGVTDPATQHYVAHSRQVYDSIHNQLETAYNAAQQGGAQNNPEEATETTPDDESNEGYAQGGGIPAGPAGAGVKPQAPTGNAGRPNWTAPDPKETASEKNYAQNVSSRPATSPARGTAFEQARPDGGQRGQEWYGKGNSPYGAGRKKKAGV